MPPVPSVSGGRSLVTLSLFAFLLSFWFACLVWLVRLVWLVWLFALFAWLSLSVRVSSKNIYSPFSNRYNPAPLTSSIHPSTPKILQTNPHRNNPLTNKPGPKTPRLTARIINQNSSTRAPQYPSSLILENHLRG
jgi:hypothetical protein